MCCAEFACQKLLIARAETQEKYMAGLSSMCSVTAVRVDTAKGGAVCAEMALTEQISEEIPSFM